MLDTEKTREGMLFGSYYLLTDTTLTKGLPFLSYVILLCVRAWVSNLVHSNILLDEVNEVDIH